MSDRPRLTRLSEILYWTALILSVVLPLLVLLYAAISVSDPASLLSQVPGLAPDTPVSREQAGLVAAVALVAVLPMVAALRGMTRLFDRYRMGEVLSDANAATILSIGRAFLLVALFAVLVPTVQTLILSWQAPQKMLTIGIDDGVLGFVLAAGLLTVIGWALREAAAVKAENAGFV